MPDTTKTRPLVAPSLEELAAQEEESQDQAPPSSESAISSDEKIHGGVPKDAQDQPPPSEPEQPNGKTRFVSNVVEEVVNSWPKEKNFTPAEVHQRVLEWAAESEYSLTSESPSAVQQTLIKMNQDGKIERIARGRYIRPTPKAAKPAKRAAKASKSKPVKRKTTKKASTKVSKSQSKAPAKEVSKPDVKADQDLDTLDPKVFDINMDVAFNLFSTVVRGVDSNKGEFWRQFGLMCETFGRMKTILNEADSQDGE